MLARRCEDAGQRDLVRGVDQNEAILALVPATKITSGAANELKAARKQEVKKLRKLKGAGDKV